jgi:hypothetical protein
VAFRAETPHEIFVRLARQLAIRDLGKPVKSRLLDESGEPQRTDADRTYLMFEAEQDCPSTHQTAIG